MNQFKVLLSFALAIASITASPAGPGVKCYRDECQPGQCKDCCEQLVNRFFKDVDGIRTGCIGNCDGCGPAIQPASLAEIAAAITNATASVLNGTDIHGNLSGAGSIADSQGTGSVTLTHNGTHVIVNGNATIASNITGNGTAAGAINVPVPTIILGAINDTITKTIG